MNEFLLEMIPKRIKTYENWKNPRELWMNFFFPSGT